tara:strand:- start:1549 stop:2535 length:987 start_codon:yes stop_codon:yes gene_type:complete
MKKHVSLLLLTFLVSSQVAGGACQGKFLNPITDVCWKCIFPITIMGVHVHTGGGIDAGGSRQPLCSCKGIGGIPLPGIPIGFWEPVRLVDVTRIPLCLVSMGGLSLGSNSNYGEVTTDTDTMTKKSFYHVHWYIWPLLYWMELLTDFVCMEKLAIDVAYLTEFDPLWGEDAKSSILNPESILFGSPAAQSACLSDCLATSAGLPLDSLFWCGGCHGSLYPFTGTVGEHISGIQASLLLVERMMAKLHRQFLLWGYMGKEAQCGKYPMPLIKKSQYRIQMTYPGKGPCNRVGQTEVAWQAGKEFPFNGSDFGYLIFRKRDCCLGPFLEQ